MVHFFLTILWSKNNDFSPRPDCRRATTNEKKRARIPPVFCKTSFSARFQSLLVLKVRSVPALLDNQYIQKGSLIVDQLNFSTSRSLPTAHWEYEKKKSLNLSLNLIIVHLCIFLILTHKNNKHSNRMLSSPHRPYWK